MSFDTYKRTISKAILYRGGSILTLSLITWFTTKDIVKVTIVTVLYNLVSIVGYCIYERIWGHVKWGKGRNE